MKIIKAYPPNFAQIAAAFPVKGVPGVLYAWGDVIYNPSGITVPHQLVAHEEVHGKRQIAYDDLDEWWHQYIINPSFRLEEEVPAHCAEWSAYLGSFPGNSPFDPLPYLDKIASRLASPLYGRLISKAEAVRRITECA